MSPMTQLIIASIAFLTTHFVTSTPLRARLVGVLGRAYSFLYSLIAIALLGWMIRSFYSAPFVNLWFSIPLERVPQFVMPFALVFVICGLLTANPTLVGQEHLLKASQPARGILRITRHPLMWGFALWAASHIVARGEIASIIFFGTFLILALAGTILIDRRKAALLGEDWKHFAAVTSNLPFAAIIGGRNRLELGEIGWWKVLIGVALYFVLLRFHQVLFGVRPLL